jgi:hypothetical protein
MAWPMDACMWLRGLERLTKGSAKAGVSAIETDSEREPFASLYRQVCTCMDLDTDLDNDVTMDINLSWTQS